MMNRMVRIVAIIVVISVSGCCRNPPPEPIDVSAERILRTAPLGTKIYEIERQIGELKFLGRESSSLTIGSIVRCEGVAYRLAIEVANWPSDTPDASAAFRQSQYTGHFIIDGENIHSIKWVYADGLIMDERTAK
ncbi:MAG: hypothetical protein IBJ18_04040 [Phycisphaerales bacterium]|nr:hypothetical protein [Phycisphaerales bacterium]